VDNDDFIKALFFTVDEHLSGISGLIITYLTTDKAKEEYSQEYREKLTAF